MSILRLLSRHITVADLESPLGPTLSFSDDPVEAEQAIIAVAPAPKDFGRLGPSDTNETFCLVKSDDGRVAHGAFLCDIMGANRTVAEAAIPILPNDCIASNTPALQLLKFFADRSRPWAFVLTGTRLTGIVDKTDLWKPEFIVCIFALLLDVEQQCAEVLANHEEIDTIWATLTPGRQAKALEVFEKRTKKSPDMATTSDLVFCTTFADKPSMLALLPSFADISKRQLKTDFATMEKCRNLLAHTGESAVMELEEMVRVIDIAEGMLKRLLPQEEPTIRLVKGRM